MSKPIEKLIPRTVGYYLYTEGFKKQSDRILTRKRAVEQAIELLPSLKKRKQKRVVGIVRANDDVLMMVVSEVRGQLQIEKA